MRSIPRKRARACSRPAFGSRSNSAVTIRHPSTVQAERHRGPHPLTGQLDRRAARFNSITLATREDCFCVLFDLLGDLLESRRLGATVVLDGGADHAARVGDEVGHYQDA